MLFHFHRSLIKIHWIENITLFLFLSYFPLAVSLFLCCFVQPDEYRCGGVAIVTFIPLVGMFLRSCSSRVYIQTIG
jgi:hypothetical protein